MLKGLYKRIKRCTGGNTTVLVGMSLLPMIGALGLGVDAAQWVLWKRQLHSAADMGALAGARALADSQSVRPAVTRSLGLNNLRSYSVNAIENAPTVGKFKDSKNHVRVVLSAQQRLPFSSLFMATVPQITVEATAENASTVPNCIIALDTSYTTALSVSGSASVDMNCGMSSNASGGSSLVADGSSVKVKALSAVGQVSGASFDATQVKVNEGIAPIPDPYAGKVSMPSNLSTLCAAAAFLTVGTNATANIGPGTFCFTGISVRGRLNIAKGSTVIIIGGNLTTGSGSTLESSGVTFIFTDIATSKPSYGKFIANGSSTVILAANSTGPYAGILMYQDPRATAGNSSDFFLSGTSGTDNAGRTVNSQYQGAIYTPSTDATFSGNSGINTPCMQVVSRRVTFIGNTNITNTCPPGSGASAFGGGGTVRLVG